MRHTKRQKLMQDWYQVLRLRMIEEISRRTRPVSKLVVHLNHKRPHYLEDIEIVFKSPNHWTITEHLIYLADFPLGFMRCDTKLLREILFPNETVQFRKRISHSYECRCVKYEIVRDKNIAAMIGVS